MNNIIGEMTALLQEKLDLFVEFERLTSLLTTCDMDSIDDYITKRAALANQIDNIGDRVSKLCEKAEVTPGADDIINNRCLYSKVPKAWKPVFLLSQETIACINRCIEQNEQASSRMRLLRDNLKLRIKETSNTPKIIKYLSTSGTTQSNGNITIRSRRI